MFRVEKSIRFSRLIILSLIFLLGIFCIDRFIYYWGTSIAVSPYWHSEVFNRVTHADKAEILIVGGCRAALHFDSNIIQNAVHLNTFNAGKAAIGIGNMEFTLNTALTYQKPKYVLIVVDPNNLEETLDTAREDLTKSIPWFSKLKAQDKAYFMERYDFNHPIYKMGLFNFMGKGDELIRSNLRKITKRSMVMQDGYEPRESDQNLIKELTDKKKYQNILDATKKELSPSEFAIETYHHMIEMVKKHGAKPILVVTPMHWLYATNDLNNRVKKVISSLGKKESIPSFVYLDNDSVIAKKDSWWSDTGHLNRLGAEAFTADFIKDFKHYIYLNDRDVNV